MNGIVNVTLEGEFLKRGEYGSLNFWNHAEIITSNNSLSKIMIIPTNSWNKPDYYIQ